MRCSGYPIVTAEYRSSSGLASQRHHTRCLLHHYYYWLARPLWSSHQIPSQPDRIAPRQIAQFMALTSSTAEATSSTPIAPWTLPQCSSLLVATMIVQMCSSCSNPPKMSGSAHQFQQVSPSGHRTGSEVTNAPPSTEQYIPAFDMSS